MYFLDDISSGLADDLEYISSLDGQHYIICENYNKLLDYEEWLIIRKYQYSNIKYIFSARSYINDNFYLKLANDLDVDYKQLAMYDLNILTDHEINNFVKYLSRYNLWGRHAAKSFSDKKRFIQRKCKGEIRNLLLEVYRSQNVVSKINEILDIICRDKTCKEILLMTFVCNIMAVDISYSDIEIVLGYRINKLYFEQYNEIKELVLIEGNALRFKSSSIAAHVIAKKNFNKDILGLICKMTNVLVRHTYNAKYRNILKLMISFSNLRLIFNRDDKNISNIYVQFYENARKTQFYSNNRFFWIQYAIAVMEIKDYNAAEIYLENASSFSMERYGEDSYQVESLRARLLLEKTLYNKDIEKAFDNFEKAHNLICSNKTPEQHYPYRQASCYVEYYSTFYHYFNQEQKVAFMFMCTEMRRKMSDYLSKTNLFEKNSRKKSKEIEHILHRIETIIHKMTKEE